MKKKNKKQKKRSKKHGQKTFCHVSQCGFEKKHVNVRVWVDFEKKKKNKLTLYVLFRFMGKGSRWRGPRAI